MMIAGIDYSMTCPAICVGQNINFDECRVFYYIKDKKLVGKITDNIFGGLAFPYESQNERFNNVSEWAMSILMHHKVKKVCLEGFAMRANGRIFDIAENTGLLKHKLWQSDIEYIIPSPPTVKKFFSGKGNAKKDMMYDAFVDKTGVNIIQYFLEKQLKKDSNPISDIVDAYAMLCYGLEQFNSK